VLVYHSLPTKCTHWFRLSSSHIAVVLWVLAHNHFIIIVPLYWQILPNTCHGAHSLLSHDDMISHATPCTHPLQSIQENIILPMIPSVWKFLPRWGMSSLTFELENVLFHSKHPIELGQEDRVMKHNPILQGDVLSTHGRKSGRGDREVFRFSTVPLSFLICGQCVFHLLCPPLS
jgi:hypothetical protein